MCGICGIVSLRNSPIDNLQGKLMAMSKLLEHRGPDDQGVWSQVNQSVGLAHRRLSIIDLTSSAHQPMLGENGAALVHNGEVYNYVELQQSLGDCWSFKTSSDTETILAAYNKFGVDCVSHLRGMFSFAHWDGERLFCARDRFGIKPLYYAIVDDLFFFASEAKALLPFLSEIETDKEALAEYFSFQYTIGKHTLFKGIKQLLPGHALTVENGNIKEWRYWDIHYIVDYDHTEKYFNERLQELINDSINIHLRSDVPIGSYLSGGIDSSLIALLAQRFDKENKHSFHGKFTCFPGYDESHFAREVASDCGNTLHEIDISSADFSDNIEKVIYHLDFPVAGPGSFPQFMVSKLASQRVKVVLGGQGGDELFGGYARYLLAYFEQCIKAALDGTYQNGHFIVTAESIIPNLGVLREYKPLMQQFFSKGMFGGLDERYFRLVNRANDVQDEFNWEMLDFDRVYESFQSIFNSEKNVHKESYFDSMTHFDFKCLLPALLQVEDRMSMAHGLESRVPLLDHPLIEFLATVPADVKFKSGNMKQMLKHTYADVLPDSLLNRRDKMGFPVPLKEWFEGDLREFVSDIFSSEKASSRSYINIGAVRKGIGEGARFSRKLWGLIALELWHQQFHDQSKRYKDMVS